MDFKVKVKVFLSSELSVESDKRICQMVLGVKFGVIRSKALNF